MRFRTEHPVREELHNELHARPSLYFDGDTDVWHAAITTIDRSPGGTGTAARMAQLHGKGRLTVGESFRQESLIGRSLKGHRGRDRCRYLPSHQAKRRWLGTHHRSQYDLCRRSGSFGARFPDQMNAKARWSGHEIVGSRHACRSAEDRFRAR